jgi:threonine/homoserine/homoserine lactone efflux protein
MVAGIASGLLVIGILAAFGVAAFVAESKFLFALLRWFGVLYMLWLAYDIWRGGEPGIEHDGQSQPVRDYFRRGFITNVLNPKAAVFYVVVLPAFIDQGRSVLHQTLALSVAYAGVATIVHTTIVLLASTMRPLLQDAGRMRMTRRVLAISLLFVAVWLLWSTAEPGFDGSHGH